LVSDKCFVDFCRILLNTLHVCFNFVNRY
jgi:hypothetical protein